MNDTNYEKMVLDGLTEGKSPKQLMKLMPALTPGKQAAYLKSIVKNLMGQGLLSPNDAVVASPHRGYADLSYSEVVARFNEIIGKETSLVKKSPVVGGSGKETTIAIGDLHIPEQRFDLLSEVAKKHQGSRLIIAGDYMDFQKFSRFGRKGREANTSREQRMTIKEVLREGTAVMEALSPYFSDIIVKSGNHDERMASTLASVFPDGAELADWILESMFASIPNVTMTHSAIDEFFMAKRGDAWIGHWESVTGKVPNRGANEAVDWMLDNDAIKKHGEWNMLVQLHTHRTSFTIHRGKYAAECGCMCTVPDYYWEKPGKWGYPRHGYFELKQNNGISDWEESGVRILRD